MNQNFGKVAPMQQHELLELYDDRYDYVAPRPVSVPVAVAPEPTGSGKITAEIWLNIMGDGINTNVLNYAPNETGELTSFQSPVDVFDNYQQRIRGLITPPVSGNYTFWLTADDWGQLWLGTNNSPATRRKIIDQAGHTEGVYSWERYATQKSEQIYLEKGKQYYIEALMKENIGGDYLAVGWQLPNGTMERPIPGKRLSPVPFEIKTVAAPNAIIQVQPTQSASLPAVMPINTECNDVECLTNLLMAETGLSQMNSTSSTQPITATTSASLVSKAAPVNPTPPKPDEASFPWWMLGVGVFAAFSLFGGRERGRKSDLSGVPAKPKATKSKPTATGKSKPKATGKSAVRIMSV